jgi:hypothetical protein
MKTKILLVLLFTTAMCQAQTKVIAHKSHSGSNRSFTKAYQKNLFDINRSNFGLPDNMNIVVLDTVIALNDSVTILKMRKSNVCYPYGTSYKDLKESDFKFKTDTLIKHNVFNRKNTVAFIKSSGSYPIGFVNKIDNVVFVGFKK